MTWIDNFHKSNLHCASLHHCIVKLKHPIAKKQSTFFDFCLVFLCTKATFSSSWNHRIWRDRYLQYSMLVLTLTKPMLSIPALVYTSFPSPGGLWDTQALYGPHWDVLVAELLELPGWAFRFTLNTPLLPLRDLQLIFNLSFFSKSDVFSPRICAGSTLYSLS